jgi:hypothetical protein
MPQTTAHLRLVEPAGPIRADEDVLRDALGSVRLAESLPSITGPQRSCLTAAAVVLELALAQRGERVTFRRDV